MRLVSKVRESQNIVLKALLIIDIEKLKKCSSHRTAAGKARILAKVVPKEATYEIDRVSSICEIGELSVHVACQKGAGILMIMTGLLSRISINTTSTERNKYSYHPGTCGRRSSRPA
jgi:hypothetical protein